MNKWIWLVGLVTLVGCVPSYQEMIAKDRAVCAGQYGFQPGTESFSRCLQSRDQARDSQFFMMGLPPPRAFQ
jgi:hypothetical protein